MAVLVDSAVGRRDFLKLKSETCEPPALFVFGASYMDVGENFAAMPFRTEADFEPYGMDYFGKPTGRHSNGRLIIDHICKYIDSECNSHVHLSRSEKQSLTFFGVASSSRTSRCEDANAPVKSTCTVHKQTNCEDLLTLEKSLEQIEPLSCQKSSYRMSHSDKKNSH